MNNLLLLLFAFFPCTALAQNDIEPLETVYQKRAFELFSQVTKEDADNICFSPLSVQMVMSMVQNGAASNTLAQMQEALGTTGYSNDEVNAFNQKMEETLTYRPPFTYDPSESWMTEEQQLENHNAAHPICEMANGIWTRPGTTWHEEFLQTMRDCYKAGIGSVNFATQEGIDEINGWVSEKTHQLISKVFDEPLSEEVALVLADALYFKGSWSVPFDPYLTKEGVFHNTDGTDVHTDMMRQTEYFRVGKTENFRTLQLPYGNGGFSMTIFLPAEGTTLPELTYDEWKMAFDNKGYYTNTQLQMPSFVVEDKYDLNEVLQRMGMEDAFNPFLADFSNMRDLPVCIDKVFQCSKIAVDEKGTEAAAVTVVSMKDSAVPDDPQPFIIDRPFYFTIEHRNTGCVLFVGRINQLQGTASVTHAGKKPIPSSIHSLQGQQLQTPPSKGVYIKDGKKVVAK